MAVCDRRRRRVAWRSSGGGNHAATARFEINGDVAGGQRRVGLVGDAVGHIGAAILDPERPKSAARSHAGRRPHAGTASQGAQ